MKVLHVIPSLSPKDGGPSFAMPLIAAGLQRAGVSVDVATTTADEEGPFTIGDLEKSVTRDGVNYFYFERQSEFYKVSIPFSRWLAARIRNYDLVHIHALFSYTSFVAARLAAKYSVPYVVRPLGVLNRWGMQNRRRLLKKLSFRFIEQRVLRKAAAIHYTSQQERIEAEETGIKTRSALIPLGIDSAPFRELTKPERFYSKFPEARGREIILYLSRLDPKKGLDLLLRAFAELRAGWSAATERRHPILIIAGDGDAQFVSGLRSLAEVLGIGPDLIWTGFIGGEDKLSAMASASMYVLPSRSENFGIALVEAMAAGLPCVLTDEIGIAIDAREYDAGLVAPCEVGPLANAMRRLIDDPELRTRLSHNARRLVDDRFSAEAMSGSLIKLYDQVIANQFKEADAAVIAPIDANVHRAGVVKAK